MLETQTLTIEGIRCAVYQAGDLASSEAVVFIHGNPGPLDDWEEIAPFVARFARVVAMDLPGFGRAERARDFSYTVAGYAAYLGAVLARLGVARAHLVLHDFGAAWGVRWALDHPAALASLVLINAPLSTHFRWHFWARIWQAPMLGELFQACAWPGLIAWVMNRDNPRPLPKAFIQRVTGFADLAQKLAVVDLYRSCKHPGRAFAPLIAALRALDPPACVIWGASDRYTPVRHAAEQRDLFTRAELHVIENAGHWPFIDEPERVRAIVCRFLEAQLSGRACA